MPNTPLTIDLHEKIECAHTIESKYYVDPAVLATEKAKIFRKTWQLVGTLNQPCGEVDGRARTISDPESYFTADVAGEPIMVVRDKNGTLRGFSNVCRHRAGPIASGAGALRTCCAADTTDGAMRLRVVLPRFDRSRSEGTYSARDCV